MSKLKAGASSVAVVLGDDCFPNAESVAKYDDVHVRVVILEADRRVAFLTADMPSMLPWAIRHCKALLKELAGVEEEDSWVMCTNALSAPHTWPKGDHEQPDTPRPMGFDTNPYKKQVAVRINAAYDAAYRQAITEAAANLQEAAIGFGRGTCAINCNKNVWTKQGYGQGCDPEGFVDRTLTVLKICAVADGSPIAVMYNYSCANSVCVGPVPELGGFGKVSTGDVMGVASKYIEDRYHCPAYFLCGAMGDQQPILKINYNHVDVEGNANGGCFGLKGYVICETLGDILGGAIAQTMRETECTVTEPKISLFRRDYTVRTQDRDVNFFNIKPVLEYEFEEIGTREMKFEGMLIDDIAIVGLMTEMDGITMAEIRERSPFEKTLVTSYVNGNGKSMPHAESYDKLHWCAINSPFVKGTAELTRDLALDMLDEMKNT